ncbi:clustered mitochondria protein homolog [Striga asiatica]|uniref:Clustered mitochondria protein homolog n=1 Tax=Striga asiatica TaxID=4170 RepID=A0A5A7Q5U0_STRAF|nr:clustered mitochondria protein homolog [Striga asiatica]
MAGKSNKGRNRKVSQKGAVNSSEQAISTDAPLSDSLKTAQANENGSSEASSDTKAEVQDKENSSDQLPSKQGDAHLYPVSVKTLGGEKLELQLSPGDSVMDVRQFLLDAPETCFFTCYDLLLHSKDGSIHHLEDYNDISEVADITSGCCSLEMVAVNTLWGNDAQRHVNCQESLIYVIDLVMLQKQSVFHAALYDDRSIRVHVHRTRELLSSSTMHSSLSTMLALQHETGKNASANSEDAVKVEVPELDKVGFMGNGSVANLLPSSSKEIKCVESIVFSSFNPPPSHRRLFGDLIYLDLVTLEGNKYCITGTTKDFYINSSTGNILDPRPMKSSLEATSLVGLLQKISPKFKKALREILLLKAHAHPLENVQSVLPPNSWLGLYPVPDHKRDAARAENSLTLSFGSELIGMQRDWNEELQSCREFPQTTHQERIIRDRALYKVTSDFVEAATSGAIGVISRCIPPINPTDPECFHMYVHNNIFFSFAVDADLEQLSRKQTSEVNSELQTTSSLRGDSKTLVNKVPLVDSNLPHVGESVITNMEHTSGTEAISPDMPAESQLAESEQATYASANNDLKGTKAYQEADVPGLYNLAMAIIDYRGHRVVAQSVLPGILQGDKSDSLLYGSVDNGKKICWSEDFHSKVLEAAKRLHLKEHTVLDGAGNVVKLAAPVECKGIVGSDDRHYLLDLMRVTPRDANYTGPGSRFCILRPELISGYCNAEAAKMTKGGSELKQENSVSDSLNVSNAGVVEKAEELAALTSNTLDDEKGETQNLQECDSQFSMKDSRKEKTFNPNVFTEFKLAGSQEEISVDEEDVRKASLYLKDVVLPKFVQDLCALDVSPMDGQTLTEALHAHGINVRYVGKISELDLNIGFVEFEQKVLFNVAAGARHMPHLWDICCNEIVVRSAKHVVKVIQSLSPEGKDAHFKELCIDMQDILRDTEDHDLVFAISHFFNCFVGKFQAVSGTGITNSSPSKSQKKTHSGHHASGKSPKGLAKLKNGGYLRNKESVYLSITTDSLWSDIQEFAKLKYQFELPEDARQRVKKISVIRNLCQKTGITIAARHYDFDASTPFEVSDILNIQPVVKHSIPVCSEAKDLVETGKVQLAEGMLNEAYTLFSQAFALFQQVTGPIHREVANCCRYLAMVLYHAGDMAGAIMQQHKELIINERCLGLDHPDTAHSYGNMALFYHSLNQTELALQHMSRALLLLNLSCGPDHPDVASTFINVAMMYQDIKKMDTALRYLQEALKKNERLLGEDHIQTAVCFHALAIAFNCMGAYKLSHQNNAQKQKGEILKAVSAQKAFEEILKANPDLLQAVEAATVANKASSSKSSILKGNDNRGALAAELARKKLNAKGLLKTPTAINQLIDFINSGVPDSKKENEGSAFDSGVKSKADGPKPGPVGLGPGLGSLDAKKNKVKGKGV